MRTCEDDDLGKCDCPTGTAGIARTGDRTKLAICARIGGISGSDSRFPARFRREFAFWRGEGSLSRSTCQVGARNGRRWPGKRSETLGVMRENGRANPIR